MDTRWRRTGLAASLGLVFLALAGLGSAALGAGSGQAASQGLGPLALATQGAATDPLIYSSFLGGSEKDYAFAVDTDANGSIVVAGMTSSLNFPVSLGALDTNYTGGAHDCFVVRFTNRSTVAFATLLGGSGDDACYGAVIDTDGSVLVTGYTTSADFPNTTGAFDLSLGGAGDAFVARLTADGTALVFSTFLGGSGSNEAGRWIGLGTAGAVLVAGYTNSTDFPTTAGAADRTVAGRDTFVVALLGNGSALVWSTVVGGSGDDLLLGALCDAYGNVFVAGSTNSDDFPITLSAPDRTRVGASEGFLAKVASDGSFLEYATFVGGSSDDQVSSVAIDPSGNAYLTGRTYSSDFPNTTGVPDNVLDGGNDAFLVKVNAAGSAFVYASYLGGNSDEVGAVVTVDAAGQPIVFGQTRSADFHLVPGSYNTTVLVAYFRMFIVRTSADGSQLNFAGFFGGTQNDVPYDAMVLPSGELLFVGQTNSYNFRTTADAFQRAPNSVHEDGFLTVFNASLQPVPLQVRTSPPGLDLIVDGVRASAPVNVSCFAFTNVTVEAPGPQENGTPTRYAFQSWSDAGAANHSVACGSLALVTATFAPEYQVTILSDPPGRTLYFDGVPNTTPQVVWWRSGAPHSVNMFSPQSDGPGEAWVWSNWSDGGSYWRSIAVSAPTTFTANFWLAAVVQITTVPDGMPFLADGVALTGARTLYWDNVTAHSLEAQPAQVSGSERWVFHDWSDGGAVAHNVTAVAGAEWIANYSHEWLMHILSSPSEKTILIDHVSAETPIHLWFTEGSNHTFDSPERQGDVWMSYVFAGWGGVAPGPYTVDIVRSGTLTANFNLQYSATYDTVPSGLPLFINGTNYTAPVTLWWDLGAVYNFSVDAVIDGGGFRFIFINWSEPGPRERNNTTADFWYSYTANFQEEVQTAFSSVPVDAQYTVDGAKVFGAKTFWWARGSSHTVEARLRTATENTSLNFASWSDGGSAIHPLVASAPLNLTVVFSREFLVTIRTNPAGLAFFVDGVRLTGAYSQWWAEGSSRALAIDPVQPLAGTHGMTFLNWSDGGDANRTITATEPLTLTASFAPVAVPPPPPPVGPVTSWTSLAVLISAVAVPIAVGAVAFAVVRRSKKLRAAAQARTPSPFALAAPLPGPAVQAPEFVPPPAPGLPPGAMAPPVPLAPCPTCGWPVQIGAPYCLRCGMNLIWP